MHEVPMAPLPSAVHESLFFKIGNELADFARHGDKTTPDQLDGKSALQNAATGRGLPRGRGRRHAGPAFATSFAIGYGGQEGYGTASCVRSPKRKEAGLLPPLWVKGWFQPELRGSGAVACPAVAPWGEGGRRSRPSGTHDTGTTSLWICGPFSADARLRSYSA